jgi:hypothetical protein
MKIKPIVTWVVPIRTWVGVLNFLVLQWFGVRLARRLVTIQENIRPDHVVVGSDGVSLSFGVKVDVRHEDAGWSMLRWIWPLTGWWTDYRWIKKHLRSDGES